MPTAYIETTIPSYLAAPISRDPLTAERQRLTNTWWNQRNPDVSYISELVWDEAGRGDPEMAGRRLEILRDLPILPWIPDIDELHRTYMMQLGLSAASHPDMAHIAWAVAHGVDYLVTWNFRHIANAVIIRRLTHVNRKLGRNTPLIVTPENLMGRPDY